MSAAAMAKRWVPKGFRIQLIESPDIGIIGVGEGSTPRLKHFFDQLGISESDWMPKCNATFKNGITFKGWSTKPGCESYFHPFASYVDNKTQPAFFYNASLRRLGAAVNGQPDNYYLTSILTQKNLAPLPNINFPFEVEYGYHFDSHLLGAYLRDFAVNLGANHIQDEITSVNLSANGDISSLTGKSGACYSGDIFIDCTGFSGKIIQQALNTKFVSYADNLFNDAAVVFATPAQDPIGCETLSTALSSGWAWQIPLRNRTGNGYVYASPFSSADQAETELRKHLGLLDADIEARHLKMKVGRLEQHWNKNCLAVGLSQGFIEPLEATALNLVCNTIEDFIHTFESSGFQRDQQSAFNQRVNSGYESIRDYIVAHYVLNSRADSDYWIENGKNKNLSGTLNHILDLWFTGKDLATELEKGAIRSSYRPVSWYALFGGYGIYPNLKPIELNNYLSQYSEKTIAKFLTHCALNFRDHNSVLAEQ
ncbi:tryptophan 7-halogenase [Simiduia sp. 21SJ11W-1]|nr:tryptophan halogenase family protein [Simiduia sp. 21SJ11W-1]UTA49683.1 tryptophan 7-halogenase [Simiduia sp. 21SJ11W-1]